MRVVHLFAAIPRDPAAQVMGRQVLRSGTSVGAHYREAHRVRSTAEFISKMEAGLQELDETMYWLELLVETNQMPQAKLAPLMKEGDELIRIFVAAVKAAKAKKS